MKKCQTPYCKGHQPKGKYCSKCRTRKWRAANPLMAAFSNLKAHAKWRGKEFKFTVETFEKFCLETGYLSKRLAGLDVTIDRVIEEGPYSYENCQVLFNQDNVSKYHQQQQRSIEQAESLIGKEELYSGNPL